VERNILGNKIRTPFFNRKNNLNMITFLNIGSDSDLFPVDSQDPSILDFT
jgi:hypothetical protein